MKKVFKAQYGIGLPEYLFGMALIVGILIFAGYTHAQSKKTPHSYAAPNCAYSIKNIGDTLVPVDESGTQIGFFERHADGTVQLTTPEGFALAANECIKHAGFDEKIGSIRPAK